MDNEWKTIRVKCLRHKGQGEAFRVPWHQASDGVDTLSKGLHPFNHSDDLEACEPEYDSSLHS